MGGGIGLNLCENLPGGGAGSVALLGAAMAALGQEVALVSINGRIIGANALWMQAVGARVDSAAIDADLLEVLRARAAMNSYARQMLHGLEAILCGARRAFSLASAREPARGVIEIRALAAAPIGVADGVASALVAAPSMSFGTAPPRR